MGTLRLKNTSSVKLHGKDPGEEFDVETDESGAPSDVRWHKRLRDEERHKVGAVQVVAKTSKPNDNPAPPPAKSEGGDPLPKFIAEKAAK